MANANAMSTARVFALAGELRRSVDLHLLPRSRAEAVIYATTFSASRRSELDGDPVAVAEIAMQILTGSLMQQTPQDGLGMRVKDRAGMGLGSTTSALSQPFPPQIGTGVDHPSEPPSLTVAEARQ